MPPLRLRALLKRIVKELTNAIANVNNHYNILALASCLQGFQGIKFFKKNA